MNIELTDKQIDAIVISELRCQIDFCDNESVVRAAQELLDYYTGEMKNKEEILKGPDQGRDFNSLVKGW